MSARLWASTPDVATAADEVAGMSREQLVARINFLAPALTDDGLRGVAIAAMLAEQRPLDREALGQAQRERERPHIVGQIDGVPVPVRGLP